MKILCILVTSLTIMLFFNINSAKAQNGTADSIQRLQRLKQLKTDPVSQKNQQRNYYQRTLKIDSVKAEQVLSIQRDYKAGMKLVEADQSLDMDTRKKRIKSLMEEKNSKLELLLDAVQQSRIIPPGEPRRSKGTVKDNKGNNKK